MWGDMSKCGETSSYGFPVLYSYGLYKCTATSLGINEMKKLANMIKQVKMIKLLIMRLRSVSGSLENISQSQPTTEFWSALGYLELGSAFDYRDIEKLRYSGQP